MTKPTKAQISEAMKVLAACREPKNMKRGNAEYYSQLAKKALAKRWKKENPEARGTSGV